MLIYFTKVKVFSRVLLFVAPWTVAPLAPLSMGFSRQEHWHGLPFPFPGDFPNPGIRSNSGLLHCRQILYHLSHQESPYFTKEAFKQTDWHSHQ